MVHLRLYQFDFAPADIIIIIRESSMPHDDFLLSPGGIMSFSSH